MRIFVYGDGSTWGKIPNVVADRASASVYQLSNSFLWWAKLVENGENLVKVNAVCGRTVASECPWALGRNSLKTIEQDLNGVKTDLAIIFLGANDCMTFYNLSAGDIAKSVDKLAKKIQKLTGAEIMLISPPKINHGDLETGRFFIDGEKKSTELDALYKELASKRGYSFVSGIDLGVGVDGEHLSIKDHKELGERVVLALEQGVEKE